MLPGFRLPVVATDGRRAVEWPALRVEGTTNLAVQAVDHFDHEMLGQLRNRGTQPRPWVTREAVVHHRGQGTRDGI